MPPMRPLVQPMAAEGDDLTDQPIVAAVARGADFLIAEFDPNRHELRDRIDDPRSFHTGLDALCVYALLQSNEAIDDPRLRVRGPFMKACLDRLKQLPVNPEHATYAHALRATALALHHREEDKTALRAETAWLVNAASAGAYTYDTSYSNRNANALRNIWDNSNSQYGLLGVWSAAEAGVEVPTPYWRDVEKHWDGCQSLNGQWDYHDGGPSGSLSMTAAGVASLFVTHDYLDAPSYAGNVGLPPFPGQPPPRAHLVRGRRSTPSISRTARSGDTRSMGSNASAWPRASNISARTTGTASWRGRFCSASGRTGRGRA